MHPKIMNDRERMSQRAPESLLWDGRRRSWIMTVPPRAFIERRARRAERYRPTIALPGAKAAEPLLPWTAAVLVLALVGAVITILFLGFG